MISIRKVVALGLALMPPSWLKNAAYRILLGFEIGRGVRIGHSLLNVSRACLRDGSRIGNFNIIKGLDLLVLDEAVHIGNHNRIIANSRLSDATCFEVRKGGIITNRHYFDLIDSICIGEDSVIGGQGSQFWTHGFDVDHNRIQAGINIGENCYIGSHVVFNLAVCLGPRTIVGAGAVVTRSFSDGCGFIGGNPAKLIHRRVSLESNPDVQLIREYSGKKFFRKKSQ